jgi:hypothetical protein
VFLSAFLLEAIGTVMSIMGLVKFLGIDYLIISLAIAFDIAKLSIVSFLYKEWNKMSKILLLYLTAASIVLMTITSTGASGYLSAAFQKSMVPTKNVEIKLSTLNEERNKLQLRKEEIDKQIANLPSDYVKGRIALTKSFDGELQHLNERLIEIDQQIPELKIDLIDKQTHAGPITFISDAFKVSPETAMSYLIGLIIFVFDPLAIALILSGNYLIEKRSIKIKKDVKDDELIIPEIIEECHDEESDEIGDVENEIIDQVDFDLIREHHDELEQEMVNEIVEQNREDTEKKEVEKHEEEKKKRTSKKKSDIIVPEIHKSVLESINAESEEIIEVENDLNVIKLKKEFYQKSEVTK